MTKALDQELYQQFVTAVKKDPQDVSAWMKLGDLLAEAGDEKRALQCYQRIIRLDSDNPAAQVAVEQLSGEGEVMSLMAELEDFLGIDSLLHFRIPFYLQVLLALLSFLLTLILADAQQWNATDLVWSLWISSLVLGFLYLFSSIAGNMLSSAVSKSDAVSDRVMSAMGAGEGLRRAGIVVGGLFMLVFFSIHFGMFHFVHSVFLNMFFPLVEEQNSAFPNVFQFIQICLVRYWPIVLFSGVTQLSNFLNVINAPNRNDLSMPYKNVIKMHISIFVFAGLSGAGMSNFALPYLLILYFFPFGALFQLLKKPKQEQATSGV
ncbi:MAG: hypothetical protein CVU39_20900 [Chloroflexi bacterium HGW-Chloroflexi-10]|nr:MAG: hypothetical protein CVU39_20900 [Chloroflexi bacterium HGW-Chloroflexi-10]